jgi:membrane protease YdiL (CAAX protease family)
MSTPEDQPKDAGPEKEKSAPPFHPFGTVIFTWLLLLFGVLPALSNLFAPAKQTVELRPRTVQAAIRITERNLAASAAEAKRLLIEDPAQAMSTLKGALDHGAEVYSELVEIVKVEERLDLLARRAVIEAERGSLQAAEWAVSALDDSEAAEEFKDVFAEAYTEGAQSTDELGGQALPELPSSGWTRDSLLTRRAQSRKNVEEAVQFGSKILEDGRKQIELQTQLRWVRNSCLPFGLLALLFWWRRSFERPRLGLGLSTPPWDYQHGLGVIVRAAVFGMGLANIMFVFGSDSDETTFFSWGGLWLSLPMLYLTTRYLLKPHGLPFMQTFGLGIVRDQSGARPWFVLLGATCLLLSAQQLSLEILSGITNSIGLMPRWSDFVIPDLVLGDVAAFRLIAVDELLFGPICLELAFRGLLYQNLRLKMSTHRAALLSAVLFALLFFTSLPSFLGVVCMGYLWSLSYEYTRSLIPGLICHIFWNATNLAVLASYR